MENPNSLLLRPQPSAPLGTALLNLGITVRPRGPTEQRVPCPRCDRGLRDDALGVNIDTGVFHCFRCGYKGQADASKDALNTGMTYKKSKIVHQDGLSDWAQELWAECRPLRGVAIEYLQHRHCVIPPADGDLRFHPKLRHPCGHVGAALVALVTDANTAKPLTMHQTWITSIGKAPIEKPRLLLAGHRKSGGVIRLWPDEAVTRGLAVAEGIETALAGAHGYVPVWSCIDTGNMARLPVLPGIESLTVFADNDPAGISAADELAQRWADAGRDALIAMPSRDGFDVADELTQEAA